jgi:uncharacterized protein YecT (DUF1311 family)
VHQAKAPFPGVDDADSFRAERELDWFISVAAFYQLRSYGAVRAFTHGAPNMIIDNLSNCAALLRGPSYSILLLANLSSVAVGHQTVASATSADFHSCISRSKGMTAKMQSCQSSEYALLDRTLNKTYKNVMGQLGSKELRARLVQSQRVWIWRRDEDCKAKIQASAIYGGSAADLVYQDCRINMVRERIEWLKKVPRNPGYLTKV